jgi:hypothetical protein
MREEAVSKERDRSCLSEHLLPEPPKMVKPDSRILFNRRQPPLLIQVLALSLLLGIAISTALISLLLLSNLAGLRDLIAQSGEPCLALFLLYFLNALTFGSVTMGATIMGLPWHRAS